MNILTPTEISECFTGGLTAVARAIEAAVIKRLVELEKQEPAYLLTPDGKCYAYGSTQPLSAGHADATLLKLYTAAGASPVEPSESVEHWYGLYVKKCQELHDEKARLGAEIETLELAAIDDAERYAVPPSQAQPERAPLRDAELEQEFCNITGLETGINPAAADTKRALVWFKKGYAHAIKQGGQHD